MLPYIPGHCCSLNPKKDSPSHTPISSNKWNITCLTHILQNIISDSTHFFPCLYLKEQFHMYFQMLSRMFNSDILFTQLTNYKNITSVHIISAHLPNWVRYWWESSTFLSLCVYDCILTLIYTPLSYNWISTHDIIEKHSLKRWGYGTASENNTKS